MAPCTPLRWRGGAAATLFGLFPVVGLLAPLGIAPLSMVAAAVLLWASWPASPWRFLPRTAAYFLAAVNTLAMVSSLWSLQPVVSVKATLQLAAVSIAFLTLVSTMATFGRSEMRIVARWSLIGLGVAALLMVADRMAGNSIIGLLHGLSGDGWQVYAQALSKRGVTVVAVFMWPLAWLLLRTHGRRWAAAALAIGAAGVTAGYSSTAVVALAVGALAAIIFQMGGRGLGRAVAGVLMLAMLSLPWGILQLPKPQALWDAAPWISGSSHHRLTIWGFVSERIAERPILGWGMDASRMMPGADDSILVQRSYNDRTYVVREPQLPLHPHNAIIQWWLELGFIGVVLIGAFVVRIPIIAASRVLPADRAFSAAGFAAALTAAASAFGAWQSWWLLALAMIATLPVGLGQWGAMGDGAHETPVSQE